jgi:transposase
VFHYRPGRAGEHADEILDGFDGAIQVDAYGGYSHLAKPARKGGRPLALAFCRVGGVVTEPRPSQIRTCRFPASGSSRSSFAQVRLH